MTFRLLILLSFLYPLSVFSELPKEKKEKLFAKLPYPNQSMYLEKGFVGALALGVHKEVYDNKRVELIQWQSEASFHYTPWFSGGLQARIIAGKPTDSLEQVRSRYVIVNRFHFPQEKWSLRVGPYVGLKTHNISEDIVTIDNANTTELLRDSRTSRVYGVEVGGGGIFTPAWGWTSGVSMENFLSDGYTMRLSVGGSWNLSLLRKRWRDNSKGMMLYLEAQTEWTDQLSQTVDHLLDNRTLALILGVAGAF